MSHRVLPIRHHGPGSARALDAALDAYAPDAVVVEGPPEAESLLGWLGRPDLVPPVAMRVQVRDAPHISATYPLASWSPEWRALVWAHEHSAALHLMDLPLASRLALVDPRTSQRSDRLGVLAGLAGFESADAWWEHLVESRADVTGVFDAVIEAIHVAREDEVGRYGVRCEDGVDSLREAAMRRVIRRVLKSGAARVAVVCGAWHAPALLDLGGVGLDNARLRGLARVRVDASWIPSTPDLLRQTSDYGAGVASPGWAAVVASGLEDRAVRWVCRWADALRDSGQRASAAQVMDAVRIGETLASLREHAVASRGDLDDAVQAVFGAAAADSVRRRVVIGDDMGRVPLDAPTVPLARAVRDEQRRLRLPVASTTKSVDLDLRSERGLDKSRLLHRLHAVNVGWARLKPAADGALGTFRETWTLAWTPSCDRALVAASPWGVTPADAATSTLIARADTRTDLALLADDLATALLADLPQAVTAILAAIDRAGAAVHDPARLLAACPALARASVYGSVRGAADVLGEVVQRLLRRGFAGLPALSDHADDDLAVHVVVAMRDAEDAVRTVSQPGLDALWIRTLWLLQRDGPSHPQVRGRACRRLVDRGQSIDLTQRVSAALSAEPDAAAAWLEGFLAGSGHVLVHRAEVWGALDRWLVSLTEDAFDAVLPVLRRALSDTEPDVRRQLARVLADGAVPVVAAAPVDADRAEAVWQGVARWIGELPERNPRL